MTRMLDRHYHTLTAHLSDEMKNDLVAIDIGGAARWFLSESDQEFWRYREDFPKVVPPFEIAWMEYEVPRVIQSSERRVENHAAKCAGCLAITLEIETDLRLPSLETDAMLRLFGRMVAETFGARRMNLSNEVRQNQIEAYLKEGIVPRWVTLWWLYAEPIGRPRVMPISLYAMYLDEEGACMSGLGCAFSAFELPEELEGKVDPFADVLPYMFAISLTHCKNVRMSEAAVPPAVARKRRKQGKPEVTYKVLDILPMRKVSAQRKEGEAASASMRALHVVRGHFKSYGEDAKLFGKHTGTYFWHMAARGSNDAGRIEKRYRVREGAR